MNRIHENVLRAESHLRNTLLRTYPVPAIDTAAALTPTKGTKL